MNRGFIHLWRKITEWEWYNDTITKCVFIHLLLTANHKKKLWRGITIERGEVIIGRKNMAKELSFSEMQIRTALKKLKSTNELTIKTTNKYSIVKLLNYELHHPSNQPLNQQVTNKQPTNNQQITTTKNEKNEKNEKNTQKKDHFDTFWEMYPRKTGRKSALSRWKRMSKAECCAALAALPSHVASKQWVKDGGEFIPHPATWLNQNRWEDEIDTPINLLGGKSLTF